MNFEAFGQRGSSRWVLVVVAALGIWLAFAWGGKRSVDSSWGGEGPLDGAVPQNDTEVLSGLFSKRAVGSTGLANDPHDPDMPWGNPTDSTAAVMTQGYGVGTHAPAAVWGAIDIALDGNGDGKSDPASSDGAPVYATMRGVVKVTPNSNPGGNHVWVIGDRYKTGYAHLKAFAVQTGQVVDRGTLIGYMGSTGHSSGPHLDYQVWKDGVNQNPLEYGALSSRQ